MEQIKRKCVETQNVLKSRMYRRGNKESNKYIYVRHKYLKKLPWV